MVNNINTTFVSLGEIVEKKSFDTIDKHRFFKMAEDFNLSLEALFKNRSSITEDNLNKFNKTIIRCKQVFGIDVFKSVIFLEEKYIPFKKIIELLNKENRQTLVNEMAERYNIKLKKNALKKVLIF